LTREQFIDHYVEFFVKNWTKNIAAKKGLIYNDKPFSTTRILAETLAQAHWDMMQRMTKEHFDER
jgi:hypothetical protein